jgi:fatty-acyl-CoA synthase
VVLKPGEQVAGQDLIDHVRERIAKFKAPEEVEIVDALPKTSTGKIQKYVLREQVWAGRSTRVH